MDSITFPPSQADSHTLCHKCRRSYYTEQLFFLNWQIVEHSGKLSVTEFVGLLTTYTLTDLRLTNLRTYQLTYLPTYALTNLRTYRLTTYTITDLRLTDLRLSTTRREKNMKIVDATRGNFLIFAAQIVGSGMY
jgi:hypothetical protein